MATNPYVNKVMKSDGTTIIDISDSTVTAETLAEGITAYNAAGELITGEMTPAPVTTWEKLQFLVRNNLHQNIPIGTRYSSILDNRTVDWVVIDKDRDTPADTRYTHSLTLRLSLAYRFQTAKSSYSYTTSFNEERAIYYVENGLSAGAYRITYASGSGTTTTRKFTLTKAVPAGGQLRMTITSSYIPNKIISYASATSTSLETVSCEDASGGTSLGTISGDLYNQNAFGSNSYNTKLRQWLNSYGTFDEYWTPTNTLDRTKAIEAYNREGTKTTQGFLDRVDPEMLAVVGQTSLSGIGNDYFFLLSESDVSGNSAYQYYTSDTARKLYYTNSSTSIAWWLRPVNGGGNSYRNGIVTTGGTIDKSSSDTNCNSTHALAIACNII